MVFHTRSNYGYHVITKELASESEGDFSFLGEKTEKYKTFSVTKTKEVKSIY